MTNEEIRAKVESLIDHINETQADTILAMVQPRFVDCDAENGTLTMAYPALNWERNPLGVMQGGIVATLMDFSAGCLAISYSTAKPVTVSMQVSYLRGTPIGGEVYVRARATKTGRTLVHVFAECYEPSAPDKLTATANIVYMVQ